MRRSITVEPFSGILPSKMKVEMVERKGLGHPDTLADGLAEEVSVALSKEYLKRFGTLMHHNTDQVEIVGGEISIEWGGGDIIKPIEVILSGRATNFIGSDVLPVHEIAMDAVRDYISEILPNLDMDRGVVIESKIGRGSADLVNVFKRENIPLANDTSFGVGFAPYTNLENLVLKTEEFLNSRRFKKMYPAVGEDIKVMGLRTGNSIKLTIAAAMVSRFLKSPKEYLEIKESVSKEVCEFVRSINEGEVEVFLNTADHESGEEPSHFYLTLSGTSAEMGDDGSVGRGNRVSGLITPCRPMSMEAAAGKNPYNHVGKIYNILAFRIARRVVEEVEGVNNAYVKILSQIGKRIDHPKIADVQVDGNHKDERIRKIADEELERIQEITRGIIERRFRLF